MPKRFADDSVYGVYVGVTVSRNEWTDDGKFDLDLKYSLTADGSLFITENLEIKGADYSDTKIYPKNLNGFVIEVDAPKKISLKVARDQ